MKGLNDIINGCLKNNRKSQYDLYHYCFDAMMSICMRYEKDQEMALEVLNMSFMKILKNLSQYKSELPFAPWFKRITVNTAIDEYRKKVRRRELEDNEIDYLENLHDSGSSGQMEWIEDEYLQHLLMELNEDERIVFSLFAIDGMPHKEIAELLQVSERSSIRYLSSARRQLQAMLIKDEKGLKKA